MGFELFTEEDRQKERELLASYDLDVAFFDSLGFKIKQIVPERNCFRIETDKGFFCLKKMSLSVEEIYMMQEMTEHLRKNGFSSIFDLAERENHEILIPYGGSRYYLTKWMDGRDSDYLNLLDIKAAVEALAAFHHGSEGFVSDYSLPNRRLYGQWVQGFSQRLQELRSAKKQVLADSSKEDGAQILVDYVDKCEKSAIHSLQLLEASFYEYINARDEAKRGFIHHDFGLHNILHTFDNQTYIGGLEYCAFDIRMHDLGHFLYRIMRRRGWDLELALDLMGCYNECYKLEKEDYQALTAYLAFPHDFRQLYRQHYIEGREAEDLEELERINVESEYNRSRSSFLVELERYSKLF